MKIEWPLDRNEIVQNRKPETIEEWARIHEVTKESLGEVAWNAVLKFFEGAKQ